MLLQSQIAFVFCAILAAAPVIHAKSVVADGPCNSDEIAGCKTKGYGCWRWKNAGVICMDVLQICHDCSTGFDGRVLEANRFGYDCGCVK
ncbi:hypothetical protein A1F99_085450 [Pyrenophora tritici-repentis]|nr:hypothetical protein A1F99_085450 [Pyrenophora tritici-repentis]